MPQPSSSNATPTKRKSYRASKKREMTRSFKEEAFESAAWKIFSSLGLDAATVRDIVSLSNVSPGSFYNYYKTKERIFDILLVRVTERVKQTVLQTRTEADDLETMLTKSHGAVLRELLSINGAPSFFELNQHHIRARLFTMKETRDMLDNLKQHLLRLIPISTISPDRMTFIAASTLTMGLESLLYMARNPLLDIDETALLAGSMAAGNIRGAVKVLSPEHTPPA
ncbi:MAG: TetR/AcrR family transcriptional regulator [Acetobacter sp.]|uniref:TetR/AcrR family transcriptional regulator n=1 Tax=Acetobacter sp. TaxID=440 RepID=UPI003F9056C1